MDSMNYLYGFVFVFQGEVGAQQHVTQSLITHVIRKTFSEVYCVFTSKSYTFARYHILILRWSAPLR